MTHIRNTAIAVALTASAASLALAQRSGGYGGDKKGSKTMDAIIRESPVGLRLSNGDVEKMSPIRLLIDKRKDLKLTDDQQSQLKSMDEALKAENAVHFKALDSLRSEIRPRAGADAETERIRTQIARETVVGAVKVIRGNYAASLKGAIALLDDTQKPRAEELLAKQAADAEKTLQEKLGAGRASGGSGRRGGPPPGIS